MIMNEALAGSVGNEWFTRERMARVVVVIFFFALEVVLARGFAVAVRMTETHTPLALTRLLASGCLFLFVAMMIGLTVVRDHPRLQAAGSWPRISAILGTNLVLFGVLFLPERGPLNIYESAASAIMILTSNIFCVVVLYRLGRSFSIMAEARTLVTDGPYSLVRHPLYLVEEIGVIGAFIQVASWPAALLFAAHFAFQLQRMRNEERVLTRAFPRDYRAYSARTARFIPGVW
jgi:protein-S-isoprenylcysteine O-methyltransferase Ste14